MPFQQRISRAQPIGFRWIVFLCLLAILFCQPSLIAQQTAMPQALRARIAAEEPASAIRRAHVFATSHQAPLSDSPAAALATARTQHAALLQAQATSLNTAWKPVGPIQVQSLNYGLVTGRVTALALDPNDTNSNTLYVGTSGGGVWKSSNATSSSPTFTPLTDTLSAFSPNSGTSVIPSLSFGALSVQPGGTGVILAGTGDPNDAADSYYGEGILRSTDGGQTWSLAQTAGSFSFVGEGVAGFAWSTTSPQLVVAAVSSAAEAAHVGATTYPGVRGLYYSVNGGQTWTLATIQDGSTIIQNRTTNYVNFRGNAATSVVWNPIRKTFYAAIRSHGYYESSDGANWTRMANQPGSGLTTANCQPRPGDYGLQSCPIFRGTLAVQPVTGDLFAITVDPNNGNQGLWQDVCAKSGSACASSTVAWATQLDASPVENRGTIPQGDYSLTLAVVPAATALSATDTLLFVGTADLYRCSLQGGCALRNTTNATTGCAAPAGVAPAQHAIAWGTNFSDPATPTMYFGNDGGLWRSLDGVHQQAGACSADDATHFDNLNGSLGSLAEIASLASDPNDANVLLAALGANGSAASTTTAQASASAPWTQLNAAESGAVAIDQGNGSNWLLQAGAGVALHACTSGKLCSATDFSGPASIGSAQVSGDLSLTDPPALLDPALNTNALIGTCRVWRGPESGNGLWSISNAISAPLGGIADNLCNGTDATIRSLAAGGQTQVSSGAQNSGSPVLYAGISGALDGGSIVAGHIFRTASASTAGSSTQWTDLTGNSVTNDTANRFNAGGFDVSSIAVDPNDNTGMTVYATIQGFGYPHIYRSTNGGTTWLNISANLPNAPANAVAVDPNDPRVVYVAMDTGVYVAQDVTTCVASTTGTTGACWSVYGTALPNAPVTSLVATQGISIPGASSAGVLRAGTYGRGIWQMPLLTAGQTAASPIAVFSPASLTFGTQAAGTSSALQSITLTNTGTAAMHITGVFASTGFAETDTCSGTTVTVNGTCVIQVLFAPTVAGTITGTVQVVANLPGGYASVSLAGTATGVAGVLLSPASISFGNVAVHATSSLQTVTIRNTGSAPATLSTPVLSTDFTLTANTCGTILNAGDTCTLSIAYTPTASGTRSGILSLADASAQHAIALQGTGVAGTLSASPTSIAFYDATLNTTTAVRNIVLTNSGNGALKLGTITASDDFAVSTNCNNVTLAGGATCTLSATFTPKTSGTHTGSVSIPSDSNGLANTITTVILTGNGKSPFNITLLPAAVDFGTQLVATTSAAINVTISNTGTINGALNRIAVSADDFLLQANTCGTSLAPQTGCTVSVVFRPTASGTRTGTLTIISDGGTQTVPLAGIGTSPATDKLSPLSLTFAQQVVNTTSAAQTVTLTNDGDVPLTLVAAQILSGDFTAVNACGPTLPAHTACGISVSFAPKHVGALTGVLQIADVQHAQTIALNGTAIAGAGVSLTPSALTFANTGVGNAGAPQTLTLTNNGGVPLQLSAVTVTGNFGIVSGSSTCTTTTAIPIGGACSMDIAFIPDGAGARTGSVVIASNAATQTAQLSGTGIDFTFTASGATTATVSNGTSATYALLLRPTLNTSDAVTFACAGAPVYTKCTITPQYRDLSATGAVTVTVLAGTTANAATGRTLLLLLLPLPLWILRRKGIRAPLLTLAAIAFLITAQGCGSNKIIPPDGSSGGSGGNGGSVATPTGTYTITVSATAAGVTHTVPLTLKVQ